MSNATKSDKNFLLQGSILAAASIISRAVGLIYRIPLTAIIGKRGNDYYGTAFEVYNIILIISSFSIPLAVSKLVAARIATGEAKNAQKVLRGSLVFAGVMGFLAMLIVYFGADFFTGTLLKTPLSAIALKVLAPTLFVVAILGVFRGFFQGLNTTVPSAISQVAEQIVNAIVSIVAAMSLVSYGAKVGGVLGDVDGLSAAYGAAGGTLGTLSGAITALIFIIFVSAAFMKRFRKRVKKDRGVYKESYSEIVRVLVMTIIPVLLSTTLYNLSSIVDQGIFKNIAVAQGYSAEQISEWWGVFTGQFRVLVNVPLSFASSLAATVVPAITTAYKQKNRKTVRKQIHSANRFIMILVFPCTVGLMALARPLMELLFSDIDKTSYMMLVLGSVSIIFFSISTLSNSYLQGIDKMRIPVINAAITLVVHCFVLVGLMVFFHLNIYAVIWANTFYAFMMCVLNGYSVKKYTRAKQNILSTYVIPGICSTIMGVVVLLAYKAVDALFDSNLINVVVGVCVGGVVYFISMLLLRGLREQDMLRIPKVGGLLVKIAKKTRLLN